MVDAAQDANEVDPGFWFETTPKAGPPMVGYLDPRKNRPITAAWGATMTVPKFSTIVDDTEAAYAKAGIPFKARIRCFEKAENSVSDIASGLSSHMRNVAESTSQITIDSAKGEVVLWTGFRDFAEDDENVGICFDEALYGLMRGVVVKAFRDTTGHDGNALLDVVMEGVRSHPKEA